MKKVSINTVIFFCIILLFTGKTDCAQLKGTILNNENSPVEAVRIFIEKLKLVTYSDLQGNFSFSEIPADSVKLSFRRVGYNEADTNLVIGSDQQPTLMITMQEKGIIAGQVVVTGTRTEKDIESSPIPTEVISKREIQANGNQRLNDVLTEKTGITLVDAQDGSRGVQIQGLDADYTLILIDGEPLVGRSAGTINLDRFAVGNLNRIELVRGPSSSLYGSDALAGVINLITERPGDEFNIRTQLRYGTHNSIDAAGQLGLGERNNYGLNLFINRLSSDGYKTSPDQLTNAVPSFTNYNASGDFYYNITPVTEIILHSRYHQEVQDNQFEVQLENQPPYEVNAHNTASEGNLSLDAKHMYSATSSIAAKLYGTFYKADGHDIRIATGEETNLIYFRQKMAKAEVQYDKTAFSNHHITLGGGAIFDQVMAQDILNGMQNSHLYYAFLQEDWTAAENLDVIASGRYDNHSDYAANFSPKIAASWQPSKELLVRGSVGSGFKAPSYQQLYLDFTNAVVGYTVIGTAHLEQVFKRLQDQGQIANILIDPASVKTLDPEKSLSYELGFTYSPMENISIEAGLFRNDIHNMINYQAIANKTNGLKIYTYFNLNRIYTRGIQLNARYSPAGHLEFSAGYQYLETGDQDIINKIKAGQIFKTGSNGFSRAVQLQEYGGLFNRSKHSANVAIKYDNPELKLSATLRGTIRGPYGYQDRDGNDILDDPAEYAPGYTLWYFTIGKEIMHRLTLQAGCDNILDHQDRRLLTATAGRTFFISLIFDYKKD